MPKPWRGQLNSNLKARENKINKIMAHCRFASLHENDLSKLLADKDSDNTKKAIKGCKTIYDEYLRQKNKQYAQDATELAANLKQFYAKTRKQD